MAQNGEKYVLLDGGGTPLAYGQLENGADNGELRVHIPAAKASAVLKHTELWLAKEMGRTPELFGQVLTYRDGVLYLSQQDLGKSLRQNLRVSTFFDTFLYRMENGRTNRYKVVSYDLCCGGIAFFCDTPLPIGEGFEIVIPLTAKPLLLQGQILRQEQVESRTLYAAKFVDLCEGEEAMVREAVFSLQLSQRGRSKQ